MLLALLRLQLHLTQWRHRSRAHISNTADLLTATVCQSHSTFSSVPLGSDCTMISQREGQYDSWITVPSVILKSMQMSQNRNCSKVVFNIWATVFSASVSSGRKIPVWLCFYRRHKEIKLGTINWHLDTCIVFLWNCVHQYTSLVHSIQGWAKHSCSDKILKLP